MVSFSYVFIFSSTCKVANAIGEPFDCDLFWHNPFDYRNHAQDIVYKKKLFTNKKLLRERFAVSATKKKDASLGFKKNHKMARKHLPTLCPSRMRRCELSFRKPLDRSGRTRGVAAPVSRLRHSRLFLVGLYKRRRLQNKAAECPRLEATDSRSLSASNP